MTTATATLTADEAVATLTAEGYDRGDVTAAIDSLIDAGLDAEQPDTHTVLTAAEVDLVREHFGPPRYVITDDPAETLGMAGIGPQYSPKYANAEDATNNAFSGSPEHNRAANILDNMDDAQENLARRYGAMWLAQVEAIAARDGFEVEAHASSDARIVDTATRTPVDPDDEGTGDTRERHIWQEAHDRIAVFEDHGKWVVEGTPAQRY